MGYTTYRLGATEIVAISAAAAASSVSGTPTAFPGVTSRVYRVQADVDCFVLVGVNPVASATNGFPITAGVYEYIDIPLGHKLSAIAPTKSGKIYITEASKP